MPGKLFEPLPIGRLNLQHRIIMAPLTRYRADNNHVPLPFVKEYYNQRASTPGTLLITEGTFISPKASGFACVPGLWDPEQLSAWREVTDAVHAAGSFIFCQLWALGRAANSGVLAAEKVTDLVSSSAAPMAPGAPVPRELTEEEIWSYVEDYVTAAKNAIEIAGFDGVEIHGANGYLIDQFTQDVVNRRTDKWGGSIENRARFPLAVAKAVVEAVGADRVGMRLSPWSIFQGMGMKDPVPQFGYLIKGLTELKLAYLHLVESRVAGNADAESFEKLDFAINIWDNQSPVLLAGGYRPASAVTAVDDEYRDKDIAIVFGRYFISNPDLPFRVRHGVDLTPYDRSTFYNARSKDGYIDYPFSKAFLSSGM